MYVCTCEVDHDAAPPSQWCDACQERYVDPMHYTSPRNLADPTDLTAEAVAFRYHNGLDRWAPALTDADAQ